MFSLFLCYSIQFTPTCQPSIEEKDGKTIYTVTSSCTVSQLQELLKDGCDKLILSPNIQFQPNSLSDIKVKEVEIRYSSDSLRLPDRLFENNLYLEKFTSGNNVEVGDYSFNGCKNLKEVTFKIGGRGIYGKHILQGCTSLEVLDLSDVTTDNIDLSDCKGSLRKYLPYDNFKLTGGSYNKYFAGFTNLKILEIRNIAANLVVPSYYFESANLENLTFMHVSAIGSYAFSKSKIKIFKFNPSALSTIGQNAFEYCTSLTNFGFSSKIKEIGSRAFYSCTGLEDAYIYNSAIGESAFEGCTNIKYVSLSLPIVLPRAVFRGCTSLNAISYSYGKEYLEIGPEAFKNCVSLNTLNVEQITYIGEYAFSNCLALEKLSGSSSQLKFIGAHAFDSCNLSELSLGDKLATIEDYAFNNCENLKDIIFPSSITCLNKLALGGLYNVTNLYFSEGIQLEAIQNISSSIKDMKSIKLFHFPLDLTSINGISFSELESLEKVVLPEKIEIIPASLFCGCISINDVNIPESVKRIEEKAFSGCKIFDVAFETIQSLEYIGNEAFSGCDSLTNINIQQLNIVNIDSLAFANCRGLNSITISSNMIINEDSFNNFDVKDLIFKDGVSENTIQYMLSKHPDSLTTLSLPSDLSSLDNILISNYDDLTTIHYSGEYKSIPAYFCFNCSQIREFPSSENLKEIGEYAFAGSSIESFIFPNTLTAIGDYAFSETCISNLTLPDSITSIGKHTASQCDNLKIIQIPNSIDFVPINDKNYSLLETIVFSSKTTQILQPFTNSTLLRSVTLPSHVTYITPYCFANCTSLYDINITENLSNISDGLFYGCSSLSNVEIYSNLESIGSKAFEGCNIYSISYYGETNPTCQDDFLTSLPDYTIQIKNPNYRFNNFGGAQIYNPYYIEDSPDSISGGAIAGIVIAVIVVIAAVAAALVYFLIIKRKKDTLDVEEDSI